MPAELLHAPYYVLAGAIVGASAFLSLILALPLKMVAEAVYKFPVTVASSFVSLLVSWILISSIILWPIWLGWIKAEASTQISLQIASLVFGLVIMAFCLTAFMRSPDDRKPDFAQSGVVAAIMQVVSLLIALAISALGMPLNGRP